MTKNLTTSAEKHYNQWKNFPNLAPNLKKETQNMENNPEEINENFNSHLSFGTAGMRGIMGAGLNRMNIYTVRQAAEGLASLMDTLPKKDKAKGVVISYDSRYNSKAFAEETAKVLGQHHINAFLFDDIRPTPELSYAVRELKAYAGVMITASHNPKQYNGFKVYGQDGGQLPPKETQVITNFMEKVPNILTIPVSSIKNLRKDNLLKIIGENIDEKYLNNIKNMSIDDFNETTDNKKNSLKLIYTPLHGTGKIIGRRALEAAGIKNYSVVPEQVIADPEFPTTPFPNPEFPQTFDLAKKQGEKENADILVATDPDADRLGVAVKNSQGKYDLLTGNQIAALLLNYLLITKKSAKKLPKNGIIVKSIVSSELPTEIAKSYGIPTKNVLTGFKYIAEQIKKYEKNAEHKFLFGFEESFGYLAYPFARDKDAIQSLALIAQVANFYKKQNKSLYDGLQDLYKKYGYFKEKTTFKEFDGNQGKDKIKNIMQNFRNNHLDHLNDEKVITTQDFSTSSELNHLTNQTQKMDLPKADVLKYRLKDGTWIAIRPSGTEPKIKFYIGVKGNNQAEANHKLTNYETALNKKIADYSK